MRSQRRQRRDGRLSCEESVGKGSQDEDGAYSSVDLKECLIDCGDGALARQEMFVHETRPDEAEPNEINGTKSRKRSKK